MSSANKVTKRGHTSKIWKFFTRIGDREHAMCNECNHKLSYRTTITNLKKHVKSKHPEAFAYEMAKFKDINNKQTDHTEVEPMERDNELDDEEDTIADEMIPETFEEYLENQKIVGKNEPHTPKKNSPADYDDDVPKFELIPLRNSSDSHEVSSRTHRSSTHKGKETEFDTWAKSVAQQLNNMELQHALEIQLKLQTLLTTERLRYLEDAPEKAHYSSSITTTMK